MAEAALIERIAALTAVRAGVRLGIGDDAAVLDGDPQLVLAHDMLVQDVHFRWETSSPADVGYKALAVNLSDLAAMGAHPVAALVGLGLPAGASAPLLIGTSGGQLAGGGWTAVVEGIYAGMEALAQASGMTIAGGDTTRAAEVIVGVTVVGRMAPGTPAVTRAGARPGEILYVTGPLGASAAGLALLQDPGLVGGRHDALIAAHRRPVPRLAEGAALAAAGVRAMIDVSDGLALDASHLAAASGVDVVLELDRVPLAAGVSEVAAALGVDPARFAATGGEDYELLIAGPPDLAMPGLHAVGRVTGGSGRLVVLQHGAPVHMDRLGWDHDVG